MNSMSTNNGGRRVTLGRIAILAAALSAAVMPVSLVHALRVGSAQQELSETVYAIPADLNAMGSALINGDILGWLDVADPTKPGLRRQLSRYYAMLRSAGVSAWFVGVDPQELLTVRTLPGYGVRVWFVYCVRGTTCGSGVADAANTVDAADTMSTVNAIDPAAWTSARSFAATVQWNLWHGRWMIGSFRTDDPELGGQHAAVGHRMTAISSRSLP